MPSLMSIYTFITGSKFIWKIVTNWRVLSTSLKVISETLTTMREQSRSVPNTEETQQMLLAASNILKTGVIDLPGIDEYQISADIDKFSQGVSLAITDSKNKKYHSLKLKKKGS